MYTVVYCVNVCTYVHNYVCRPSSTGVTCMNHNKKETHVRMIAMACQAVQSVKPSHIAHHKQAMHMEHPGATNLQFKCLDHHAPLQRQWNSLEPSYK